MSEISDEFKIVVVEAIQTLCPKFPRKHNSLMTFLAAMLREEVRGSFGRKEGGGRCVRGVRSAYEGRVGCELTEGGKEVQFCKEIEKLVWRRVWRPFGREVIAEVHRITHACPAVYISH